MDELKDEKKAQPRTVVDEGTAFKGSLKSSCPVMVHGSVEGTVEATGVTVSSTGSIAGKVTTEILRSIGKISGEYDVTTAQIAGAVESMTRVQAESLQLKLNAAEGGRIEVSFSTTPKS